MPKDKKIYILYLCVCIALLPVLVLRDFTPDNELRYLSIADEALRNHTFFTFTNHRVPYADKPPLYLWFVMLGKWLFGSHQMWFLSLFSLIPALVTAHVMYRWSWKEMSPQWRVPTLLMLLTCGLFTGLAVTLRMDMLMCMFIVLSLRAFFRMTEYSAAVRKYRWRFPVYVFLAVFSKGPVGILVPLLTSVAYLLLQGRLRRFGRYWGWRTWGVMLALCAVWFGSVYAEGGNSYLDNLLFHQTLDRAVNSFHHDEPFYYYLISVWYSIAPWSLLVTGIMTAAACRHLIKSNMQLFFMTAALTTFVMLSLISSKLQIYLLPAFPFMVYAAALSLHRFANNGLAKLALALPAAVFAAGYPAFIIATRNDSLAYINTPAFNVATGLLSISGIAALISLYRHGGNMPLAVKSMAAGLLAAVFAGGWSMPAMNPEIGYGAVCEKALEIAKTEKTDSFATWNIKRSENMDVYLGQLVTELPKDSVPTVVPQRPVILMTRKRDLPKIHATEAVIVGKYAVTVMKAKPYGTHKIIRQKELKQ